MRKSDFFLAILVLILISYGFLSIKSDTVKAQDSSSSSSSSSSGEVISTSSSSGDVSSSSSSSGEISSSSSGEVSSSSSSGSIEGTLNKNFTGIWKAKFPKPTEPIGGSLSNSGSSSSGCIICIHIVPGCGSNEVLVPQSCTECAHCTASTSSGAVSTRIAAHISGPLVSRVLTLKLCVREGKLEGVINQGGAFLNGVIKEQTIISENEVEFLAEDKDGKTAMIHLKLTGERQFVGRFEDGHEFEGRKLNDNRGCLAPGKGPAMGTFEEPTSSSGSFIMGGPNMSGPSGMSGTDEPSTSSGGFIMGGPNMSGPPGMSGTDEPSTSSGGFIMGGPDMSGPPGMSEPGKGESSSGMSESPFNGPGPSMGMF